MKTTINKLEKSIVEITIEETVENIAKYRKSAIDKIKKTAEIKWFRKWAVIPDQVILKNYNPEYINSVTIDEALNNLYPKALRENNIIPVSQWEIKEIVSQNPLVIVMKVEVLPEVQVIWDYKSIKLPKTKTNVEDSEVTKSLEYIQERFAKPEVAPEWYMSKMGDTLNISTQWYDLEWNKLDNTNMSDYPLVLWSNVLVPWFEAWLVGKKSWEKITLDIDFPADYHNEDFKGKKTKFEVEIWEIKTSIKPEFTPEFIKDLRWKDLDLDGFKALIKEELIETKELNARIEDESKLIDELLKVVKVDFGDSLLKNHIDKVYEEIKQNISQSGAKPLDYITSLWLTEEQYIEKSVTPVATKRLQAELILNKLGELEKIEASETEINVEIEKIMAKYGSPEVLSRLKELYVPWTKYYAELSSRIAYRKLVDTFFI